MHLFRSGAFVFGSLVPVSVEKAICANASAVREWDSNGTVFGFNAKIPGHQAGEFGHNDFYPVVIAAAQKRKDISGEQGREGSWGPSLSATFDQYFLVFSSFYL